jgi:hypothetical protein
MAAHGRKWPRIAAHGRAWLGAQPHAAGSRRACALKLNPPRPARRSGTSQKLLAEGKILKVMRLSERHAAPHAGEVLASVAAACAGADAIVSAALTQTASMSVAEQLDVPWVSRGAAGGWWGGGDEGRQVEQGAASGSAPGRVRPRPPSPTFFVPAAGARVPGAGVADAGVLLVGLQPAAVALEVGQQKVLRVSGSRGGVG